MEQAVQEKALEVMKSGEAQMINLDLTGSGEEAWMICGGKLDVFLEPILPAETLYLFGAGHLSQSTAAPSAISQAAAVAALTGPQDFVAERSRSFEARRDLAVSMLNQAKGLRCRSPEGAFYAFPDCGALIGKTTPAGRRLDNDRDVVLYLLEHAGVAAVQGSAYGLEGHFRISFATSSELLHDAGERIQRACADLG